MYKIFVTVTNDAGNWEKEPYIKHETDTFVKALKEYKERCKYAMEQVNKFDQSAAKIQLVKENYIDLGNGEQRTEEQTLKQLLITNRFCG